MSLQNIWFNEFLSKWPTAQGGTGRTQATSFDAHCINSLTFVDVLQSGPGERKCIALLLHQLYTALARMQRLRLLSPDHSWSCRELCLQASAQSGSRIRDLKL